MSDVLRKQLRAAATEPTAPPAQDGAPTPGTAAAVQGEGFDCDCIVSADHTHYPNYSSFVSGTNGVQGEGFVAPVVVNQPVVSVPEVVWVWFDDPVEPAPADADE